MAKDETLVQVLEREEQERQSRDEIKNPRHLSLDNDHFTPQFVVDAARFTLGRIDVDPSTSRTGNEARVKASTFYTAHDNGFSKPWKGTVFLNPPGGKCDAYGVSLFSCKVGGKSEWTCDPKKVPCGHNHKSASRSSQKHWWQRLAVLWEAGEVEAAVFVGFSIEILQTTQVDPVGMIPMEFPLCIPKNRLAYDKEIRSEDGSVGYETGDSPPHASVIVFLPSKGNSIESIARFKEAFSPIGCTLIPWSWV